MSLLGDIGRVGLGVATLGGSELVRAGVNAIKPDPLRTPDALRNGSTDLGASAKKPNPDYAVWAAQVDAAQARRGAAANANPPDQNALEAARAELKALEARKPPEFISTDLGQRVAELNSQGQQFSGGIQQQAQALNQTGANAAQQGQVVNQSSRQQANAVAGRDAPQMQENGAAAAQQQSAIDNLNQFNPAATRASADALTRFANGPAGPSAADAMLRLQAARDKAAQISLARSARGGAGAQAEAMKRAQAEGAGISADTRGQQALVQAQETAQNRQLSLNALQGAGQLQQGADQQALAAKQAVIDATSRVRDQDITVLRENLGAEVQTLGLNDNQVRFFTGLGEAARQQGIQAMMDAQAKGIDATTAASQVQAQFSELAWRMLAADQQVALQKLAIEQGVDMANAQQKSAFLGQVLGFVGTGLTAGAAASDKRVKRDIKRIRSMADSLRRTAGYEWTYKDEKHGKGRFTGMMAQDLEATPEFRSAVKEVGGVKMVDATRLTMAHHAALHDLQKQIDRISERKTSGR